MDIEGWEHKGLVTGAEARAILSYSDETLRKMVKDGVLKRVGKRYTVASIKSLLAGEVRWPVSETITTTRKRSSTNGRSSI